MRLITIVLVAFVTLVAPSQAAVFTVNTTLDADDGSCDALTATTDCTLAEAVDAANASAGPDEIQLQSGATYTVTGQWGGFETNGSANALPVITGDVTIRGPAVVSAGNTARIFRAGGAARLELIELMLTGGNATSGGGGGAILNVGGEVVLHDCVVRDNLASRDGGGALLAVGGIVRLLRTSILDNRAFAGNNQAPTGAGLKLLSATTVIVDSAFSGNLSENGGLAIHQQLGSVTITSTTISGHTAYYDDTPSAAIVADLDAPCALQLLGVTLIDNWGYYDVGGILTTGPDDTVLCIAGSIVSGNVSLSPGGQANIRGTRVQSSGGNILEVPASQVNPTIWALYFPDLLTAATGLGPYTEGAGPIAGWPAPGGGHHRPTPFSNAANAGNPLFCPPLDQLGDPRRSRCDAGAIEIELPVTNPNCGLGFEAALLLLPLAWLRQRRSKRR